MIKQKVKKIELSKRLENFTIEDEVLDNLLLDYFRKFNFSKPNDVKKALESKDYDSLINISEKRNKFMDSLADAGIGTRPPTHAIHTLSYYTDKYKTCPQDYPSAWAANICGFSIPIFPGLTEEDQEYVVNTISKTLN